MLKRDEIQTKKTPMLVLFLLLNIILLAWKKILFVFSQISAHTSWLHAVVRSFLLKKFVISWVHSAS